MFQLFGHSSSFPRVPYPSTTNEDTFRDRDLVPVNPTLVKIVYPPKEPIE